MSLAAFLSGLSGGTLTYAALEWIFKELEASGTVWTSAQKRLAAYSMSLILAIGALLLANALGYAALTNDSLFSAFATAFATSQAWHMKNLTT